MLWAILLPPLSQIWLRSEYLAGQQCNNHQQQTEEDDQKTGDLWAECFVQHPNAQRMLVGQYAGEYNQEYACEQQYKMTELHTLIRTQSCAQNE